MEIILLIFRGHSNQEIADKSFVALSTVQMAHKQYIWKAPGDQSNSGNSARSAIRACLIPVTANKLVTHPKTHLSVGHFGGRNY